MFRKIEENLSSSNAQPLNSPRAFPSVAGAEKDGAEHSPPLRLHLRAPLALIPSLHSSAQCRRSPGRKSPLPPAGTTPKAAIAGHNTRPHHLIGLGKSTGIVMATNHKETRKSTHPGFHLSSPESCISNF